MYDTVPFHTAMNDLHKRPVIYAVDMLKHTDGNNVIENFIDLAIVTIMKGYRQPLTYFSRFLQLSARDIHRRYFAAILFGKVTGQSSPATANILQMIVF